jgi:uncharacterized protein (TIGR02444 family)
LINANSISTSTLWDFALALYAQPQVPDTCLQLQDEYNANVCLVLAMCWLDARQYPLSDADLSRLKMHISGWTTQIVEPLRGIRRQLKSPVDSFVQDETQEQLRNLVKQAELLAEKKLLEEIERWVNENSRAKDQTTSSNLERYMHELNVPIGLSAVLRS